MSKLARVIFGTAAALCIGTAQATPLRFTAQTSAFDTYVNFTHVAWATETLSGLIDVQDIPYQTNTNPNTGESVSRFSFTGSFTYAGHTSNFETDSFLAVYHNSDGVSPDGYLLNPTFQRFAVTGEMYFSDFHLENVITGSLSLDELPNFDNLITNWSFVNGNLYLPQERATISYGGHDFVISSIPEPSTILLAGLALAGLFAAKRRQGTT